MYAGAALRPDELQHIGEMRTVLRCCAGRTLESQSSRRPLSVPFYPQWPAASLYSEFHARAVARDQRLVLADRVHAAQYGAGVSPHDHYLASGAGAHEFEMIAAKRNLTTKP